VKISEEKAKSREQRLKTSCTIELEGKFISQNNERGQNANKVHRGEADGSGGEED